MKDLRGEVKELEDSELTETQSAALERIVWRKLDRRILPICTVFFLLSFLDRTNIGNARVAGMQTSLNMSNYQYSVALTVTYVPYIAVEIPTMLLLKYVGPDLMLPAMVILWGLVCTLQGLIHNYAGLLACRFFLGMMEGGLAPGIALYLSFFYPRRRLQIRVATFFASASLSGAFSGLLAAAIDKIDGKGGKPGWAWIFILEGIFTFVFGLISFFILPRTPERARFLTQEERAYVISCLKNDGAVSGDDKADGFSWTEVGRAAKSPQLWLLVGVFFFNGALLYGLAYFEPTIVAGLGYAGNQAQLMSVPPFAVTYVLSLITAFVSDRYECRGCVLIFCAILHLTGFSIFYASKSNNIRYGSLFFSMPGAYCAAPAMLTWMANNSAPHVRRATSLAVGYIMIGSGGILTTWLLGSPSPAPNYTKATTTYIIMSVLTVVLAMANLLYLSRENRLKTERRRRMVEGEEDEGLGDRSAWFVYSL